MCVCVPIYPSIHRVTHPSTHPSTTSAAYFFMKFWLNDIRLCALMRTMLASRREAPAASIGRIWAHNRMSLSYQDGRPHTLKVHIVARIWAPPCARCNLIESPAYYLLMPSIAVDHRRSILACRVRTACIHAAIPLLACVKTACQNLCDGKFRLRPLRCYTPAKKKKGDIWLELTDILTQAWLTSKNR